MDRAKVVKVQEKIDAIIRKLETLRAQVDFTNSCPDVMIHHDERIEGQTVKWNITANIKHP